MNVSYPPHITKLESVVFHRDAEELERRMGPRTRVMVRQEGAVVEMEPLGMKASSGRLGERLIAAGVDVESVFDLELWTPPLFFGRDGMPASALEGIYDAGAGKSVFLCLNGPSFDEETRALLANRPGIVTFGVNNGGHDFRPDLWTCVDAPERFMESIWQDGRVMKFVPLEFFGSSERERVAGGKPLSARSRSLLRDSPNSLGYCRNEVFNAAEFLTEDSFNWGNHKDRGGGRSVMLVALKMSQDKRYWFAEGRTEKAIQNNETTYEILEGFFTELLPVFDAAGFSVVNATPDSRLTVFPKVDLESEVATATVDMSGTTEGMYLPGK